MRTKIIKHYLLKPIPEIFFYLRHKEHQNYIKKKTGFGNCVICFRLAFLPLVSFSIRRQHSHGYLYLHSQTCPSDFLIRLTHRKRKICSSLNVFLEITRYTSHSLHHLPYVKVVLRTTVVAKSTWKTRVLLCES